MRLNEIERLFVKLSWNWERANWSMLFFPKDITIPDMSDKGYRETKYRLIAEKLSRLPQVIRYDKLDKKEAWTLAHTFLDLDEAFSEFSKNQLPKLLSELSDKEAHDLLMEIGENFRHIAYHLSDTKFYDYVMEKGKSKA